MKMRVVVLSLALIALTICGSPFAVAAPPSAAKASVVLMQAFSDTLTVDPGTSNSVSFTYPGVRHVSLTIGAQISCPCSTNNYVFVQTIFPKGEGTVGMIQNSVPSAVTVEFDTSSWEIYAIQNATDGALWVPYSYTVTYPAGQ